MSYVVDTNIFNKLVDETITFDDLPSNGPFIATHIQIDEINNTKNGERQALLFLMFAENLGEPRVRSTFLTSQNLGSGLLS